MDKLDLIDELFLANGNNESLLEILNNSIIWLDQQTSNSRDRRKILKALNQFAVIVQSLEQSNKAIEKNLNALWSEVVKEDN